MVSLCVTVNPFMAAQRWCLVAASEIGQSVTVPRTRSFPWDVRKMYSALQISSVGNDKRGKKEVWLSQLITAGLSATNIT